MKVGDTVYLEPYGINAKRRYGNELQEDVITAIGKKYISTGTHGRYFIIDKMQDGRGYSPDYKMWLSIQDYELYIKGIEIRKEIQNNIPLLNLKQLQYIDNYIKSIEQ